MTQKVKPGLQQWSAETSDVDVCNFSRLTETSAISSKSFKNISQKAINNMPRDS